MISPEIFWRGAKKVSGRFVILCLKMKQIICKKLINDIGPGWMLFCCSLTFFNNGQHETMPLCLTSQSVITRPPREIRRMRENQFWSPVEGPEGEIEKSKRSSIFKAIVHVYWSKTFVTKSKFLTLKNVCLSTLALASCKENFVHLIKI